MSAISLRLPDSLHEKAREIAKQENVSINQMITLALAEKISAMLYGGVSGRAGSARQPRGVRPSDGKGAR